MRLIRVSISVTLKIGTIATPSASFGSRTLVGTSETTTATTDCNRLTENSNHSNQLVSDPLQIVSAITERDLGWVVFETQPPCLKAQWYCADPKD